MHIHYVEDNDLDVLNVKSLASLSDTVKITSSNTLAISDQSDLQSDVADFVLLDINRPDSISMEEDVSRIRKYSPAPIIFVTGAFADDYRTAAAAAGADGVLEKQGLSLELLQQTFSNAKARSDVIPAANQDTGNSRGQAATNTPNLSLLLGYLEQGLKSAKHYSFDQISEKKNVETLYDTISALRQFAQDGQSETTAMPIAKRLLSLHEQAHSFASSKKIGLTFEMSKFSFSRLGQSTLGEVGIKQLLEGVIKAARAGDTIAFRCQPRDGKTEIVISSNRQLLSGLDYIFDRRCPEYLKNRDAMFSLSLAVVLLNLQRDQIDLLSSGSVHRIIIRI